MKIEKRLNESYFPWVLENNWTLFMFVDTVEQAQYVIVEQYKVTNAYEFRIVTQTAQNTL